MSGQVVKIYVAPKGGAALSDVPEVLAVTGCGLSGDRYANNCGHWRDEDRCEVTFIENEALLSIAETSGVDVTGGQHRRNIVTQGVRLDDLAGKRFQVGEAIFEYDRDRPPCGYIAALTTKKMTKALWGRSGICARVVQEGRIAPGDDIQILND